MSTHAKGSFEVKTWDENPYDKTDGGLKLTRAPVSPSLSEGTSRERELWSTYWSTPATAPPSSSGWNAWLAASGTGGEASCLNTAGPSRVAWRRQAGLWYQAREPGNCAAREMRCASAAFSKHPEDSQVGASTTLRVYDHVVAALSYPRIIEPVRDVGLEVEGVALL